MPRWKMIFTPPYGNKKSPKDIILKIKNPKEKATIYNHLKLICTLESQDWPDTKPIDHLTERIYQITVGNHRIYANIFEDIIIVTHVCRKVGQKAKESDLDAAVNNWQDFINKKRKVL
jgi:phage-related protein